MFLSFLFNINKIKKMNNLYNSIKMNNFLANNNFIIFCDINKIKSLKLLNLKNEIKKLNCKNFLSNQRLIKLDDKFYDLQFLGSHFLVILAINFETLLKLINLLNSNEISFFLLHFNNLSNIINLRKFLLYKNNINILFNFNFLVYKLIIKITLILSIFIRSIFILYTLK